MEEDFKKQNSRGSTGSSRGSTLEQTSIRELPEGVRRHAFVETTFRSFTDCLLCRTWNETNPGSKHREPFIWGLIKQGFKCNDCGFTSHRKCREEALRTNSCSGVTVPKILKFLSNVSEVLASQTLVNNATMMSLSSAPNVEDSPVVRSRSRAALAVRPIVLHISCTNLPKDLLFISMFKVRIVAEYGDQLSAPSVFETEIVAGNSNPIFVNTMTILRQETAKLSFQVRDKTKLIGVINVPLSDILEAPSNTWKYQLNAPLTGYRMSQGTLIVRWEQSVKSDNSVPELPRPLSVLPSVTSSAPSIAAEMKSVYSNCCDGSREESIPAGSSVYTLDDSYQNVYSTISDVSLPSAAKRQKRSHSVSQLFDALTRLSDANFEQVWDKYGDTLEEILSFSRSLSNQQQDDSDVWNQKFQECAREKDNEEEIVQSKCVFHKLSQDFVQTACMYGKVIITEMKKPYAEKTCKPATLGGTAGGTKYIVDGILFKLAEDPYVSGQFLYGGSRPDLELANKAAGHEIKGAIAYSGVGPMDDGNDVKIPTQVLVDYWGYRLVAMPLLPIGKGKAQLVWGSPDAGATVYDDHELVRNWMKHSASHLHLKAHQVADKVMYSAGDVEGHVTTGGHAYLLDLARSMPPEFPLSHLQKSNSCVFWRLHRPEFLQHLKRAKHPPLSPDALSGWGRVDHDIHDNEIRSASKILCETVRDYAKQLDLNGVDSERALEELSVNMHRKGINVRHLGLLRSLLGSENNVTQQLCLVEMVKRSFKNLLRALLRNEIAGQSSVSDHSIKATVSSFLNEVSQSFASNLWEARLPEAIVNRFGNLSLSRDEAKQVFSVCEPLLPYVIGYILKRTGLALSPYCIASMRDGVKGFVFTDVDLMDAQPYLKRMPSFDLAAACELVEQAAKCNPINFQRLIMGAKRSANAAAAAPTVSGAHIELANLLNIRSLEASTEPPLLMLRSLWRQSPQLLQHRPDSATGVLVWASTTAAGFLVSQGYGGVLGQYLAGPVVDVRPFATEFESPQFLDLAQLLQANPQLKTVLIHSSQPIEISNFYEHNTSIVLASHCLLDLGGVMISALLRKNRRLTTLDLSNCMIGDRTATALGEWLETCPPLESLLLDNNSIGPSGITSLAAALKNNHTLTCLSARGNMIGVNGSAALAKELENNTTLLRVNINENLVPPGIKDLIRNITGSNMERWALSRLNSSSCDSSLASSSASLSDSGSSPSSSVSRSIFEGELDISRGSVSEAFLLRLVSDEFPMLTSLNLTANKMTDATAILLANKLQTNTTLRELNLRSTRFGSAGVEALVGALRVNTTLTRVDLRDNPLGRDAQRMLSQLQVNSSNNRPSMASALATPPSSVISTDSIAIASSLITTSPATPMITPPQSSNLHITLCYAPTFQALMDYQKAHLLVQQTLPVYFTALLSAIRERGLRQPDLFPKLSSTLTPKIHEFRAQVESHDLTTTHLEPSVAVGSLKFWLRSMGEPLIPMECYSECVTIGLAEEKAALQSLERFWFRLPELNRNILSELVALARQIDFFKADNGLDILKLAEVLGPNLYRTPIGIAALNAHEDVALSTFVGRMLMHPLFGELVPSQATQTRVLW